MTTVPMVEARRLAALQGLRILDTAPEEHFEAVCRTAQRLFGVASAVVSLIDADRQWLKSTCALVPQEIPREDAICNVTIGSDEVLVVPDVALDPRFTRHASVIRFYAGAPLILRPGIRVGALCLLDRKPRELSPDELASLQDLAQIVIAHLRLHEANAGLDREVAARTAHERMIEAQAAQLRDREIALAGANRLLTLAETMANIGHWQVSLGEGRPTWSEGTRRIFGTPAGTPVPARERLIEVFHPDDRAHVSTLMQQAIAAGSAYDFETRILRADGTVRDVSVSGICETGPDGSVSGLFGTMIDVTANKEAEAALARSEARYRILAEAMPLLVWATRAEDGATTYTNAWFNDYYGPIGAARAARLSRMHPEDAERIMEAWREAGISGNSFSLEVRLRRHDGLFRWHRIVATPMPISQAEHDPEWLVTALDIDDIISTRNRLQETGDLLRLATDAADAGGWDWDMIGGAVTLAPESCRIYGLDHVGPLVLRTADWTQLVHPDDRIPTWEAVRVAVDSRTDYSAEYRIVGGRSERWMLACGRVLYSESGRPYRMVGLHFDVTERKRAQVALQAATNAAVAARSEAERASAAKSEFLAAMSHEIRTPLNGILGYAELLLEGSHTREDRRRLELIQNSGAALLTVVNDILDFAKIEAGQLELDAIVFPLRGLVENTVSIVRGSALKSELTIASAFDRGLPDLVLGDANRLRQVLLNLLNNAVKFTPQGSVTVSLRYEGLRILDTGETLEALRFEVSDTGIGIAPDRHDRLFKRFSQVDGSISRRFGGTGLGLAICRELVTMMGGEIGVESEEGVGSTFWFTLALPRREVMDQIGVEPAPVASPGDDAAQPRDNAEKPLRLLLVEDVQLNRELACAVLEIKGYAVDVVEDGADAVAAVRNKAMGGDPYDVVLMDVQMPGMDGVTATRLIRGMPGPVSETSIIAMTANVMPDQIEALHEAGMDDHVGKPFKRHELYAAIERWGAHAKARAKRPAALPAARPEPVRSAAILDASVYDSLTGRMGRERVHGLLTLLEAELAGRFAMLDGTRGLDRQELAHDAHVMISAAGILGFAGISDLCREIEAACRSEADLTPLVRRLSVLRGGTMETIRSLRAA